MRTSTVKLRFKGVTSSKSLDGQLLRIISTYADIIIHVKVTQEISEATDPSDAASPTDIINTIKNTAHDQLSDFEDRNR